MLKLTNDGHKASRGLSAAAELLVLQAVAMKRRYCAFYRTVTFLMTLSDL